MVSLELRLFLFYTTFSLHDGERTVRVSAREHHYTVSDWRNKVILRSGQQYQILIKLLQTCHAILFEKIVCWQYLNVW